MGKKYIIELLDECDSEFKGIMVFGLTPRNQISAEIIPEESLTPYTEPDLEQVRKEAYEAGAKSSAVVIADDKAHEAYKLGYENGLNDAWDAARTLWNTPNRKEIFGHTAFLTALTTLTAQETIEKIRQYERRQEEDGLRQNIQTIVDQCGYTLDEIASVLQKMRES